MENSTASLLSYLQSIINDHPFTIEQEIALWLMEMNDPQWYIQLLYEQGCMPGVFPYLTYDHEFRAFFDRHYIQINHLYQHSDIFFPKGIELKIWFTTFAFNRVVTQMHHEVNNLMYI